MAITANIVQINLRQSNILANRAEINTWHSEIQALESTLADEILDAHLNGAGQISAGFIPAVTGVYRIKKANRFIEFSWNEEIQKVVNVRALEEGQVAQDVLVV